ncbi:MAG: hypothetical protein LIO54_08450 [Oscillospiraceae bacterium]|nr:hypothetical protein [Oscillospiraceae bacterium]
MTKLQIISRLWSHVNDLQLYIRGHTEKTMDEINGEIDITEYACRKYADADDDELYALDVMRTARMISDIHSGKAHVENPKQNNE